MSTVCIAYNPAIGEGPYGYVPSFVAGVVFCALFGSSCLAHIVQSCLKQQSWLLVFAVGAIGETIGWGARTWSAICPYNFVAFQMQLASLIISPSFFTAGIYIILQRLSSVLGHKGIVPPKLYLYIFCTCDVISLVVQAIGGGMAAVAVGQINGDTKPGTNIMVAGILFQIVSLSVFVFFFVAELWRARKFLRTTKLKILIVSTSISVLVIYARGFYRTAELLQGWTGYLITHEPYFVVLDGSMMVVAVTVFNIFNPAWLLVVPKVRQDLHAGSYQMF